MFCLHFLMFDVNKIQLAPPPFDVTSGDATTNATPSWVDACWDDDGPESMSALLETLKKHGEGDGFRALVDGVGASPLTALLEVGHPNPKHKHAPKCTPLVAGPGVVNTSYRVELNTGVGFEM